MGKSGMKFKKKKETGYDGGNRGEDTNNGTKVELLVGFLIRIIQEEMAPGLREISVALSRITPGTIRTQSCLMSPTHPSCM